MRNIHAAIVAVIAVGVLVAGAASATAGGKDGKGKGDKLRLVATDYTRRSSMSVLPDRRSATTSCSSETLSVRGREVGIGAGQCVTVEGVPPYATFTAQCVATLDLARGQITLQGLVEFQGEGEMSPFTVAITGGTGAYRGAGGEARVIPRLTRRELRAHLQAEASTPTTREEAKKKKGRGRH